jgi:type I restriction enzyme M protein
VRAGEGDNASLKGLLPKEYARPGLDKTRLGELIDLIGKVGLGEASHRSKDILAAYTNTSSPDSPEPSARRVGSSTPCSVVQVLVEILAPYKGRVFDPCRGSGGMFVQSEKFVEAHGGRVGDISIFDQESNHTTWRLARMNLAIRGIDANLGADNADSFPPAVVYSIGLAARTTAARTAQRSFARRSRR